MSGQAPAPLRVGVDIVEVARIAGSLERFGSRFVARIFTAAEAAYCDARQGHRRVSSYAARFAAKEAVIKVLGAATLSFAEVEILPRPGGGTDVRLHGRAARRAADDLIDGIELSMSHSAEFVVATAVGWRADPTHPVTGAAMHTSEDPTPPCRVPLLDEAQAFARIQTIYRYEREHQGRVRNLTRVAANSPAAWQLTTRALHLYETLRAVDRPLVDLLCLYTSLLNGCAYCIDDALGEGLRSGWSPEQLLRLGDEHAAHFPAATVAALRYTRAMTLDPHGVDEAVIAGLDEHFSPEAVLEISCVVGMKNFWNRLAISLRIPPEGKCADEALTTSMLGLSRAMRNGEEPAHAQ